MPPSETEPSPSLMYREANFRKAVADLRDWLGRHPEWKASGPPRVLAYNSPFLPFWMKYSEVQIPVTSSANANPTAGGDR